MLVGIVNQSRLQVGWQSNCKFLILLNSRDKYLTGSIEGIYKQKLHIIDITDIYRLQSQES